MTEASSPTHEVLTYRQLQRRLKFQDEIRYKSWRWQLPQLLVSTFVGPYRLIDLNHRRGLPVRSSETSRGNWSAAHAEIIYILRSYVIRTHTVASMRTLTPFQYDLWVIALGAHIDSAQMPPPENRKTLQRHEMLPLRLHPQNHWEMAQEKLKRHLQADLPCSFTRECLPYDLLKQTLELSRHLFAIMLVLPSFRWLERIRFWRQGLFWEFWEEEINCNLVDQNNSEWGSFWADAHIP